MYAFLDASGPIAFAHRGGAADGYENSMSAFAGAVALGYRYLETDVHVTSDGVLLAFHDTSLDRVTDLKGPVARLPWSEVSRARIGGREPIPLLEDVLGSWPDIRLNIDLKVAGTLQPLATVLRRTSALDRVCVASFSDRRLAAARRELGPRLCTSLGAWGVLRLRAAAWARSPGKSAVPAPRGVPCAQVPDRLGPLPVVTPRLVELAHARGQRVHVWTVDDERDMDRLLDLGVDGIMTDRIAVLREVMQRRGLWAA